MTALEDQLLGCSVEERALDHLAEFEDWCDQEMYIFISNIIRHIPEGLLAWFLHPRNPQKYNACSVSLQFEEEKNGRRC